MRYSRLLPFLTVATVALAGCASSQEKSGPESAQSSGPGTHGEASAESASTTETTAQPGSPASAPLSLTTPSGTTDLSLTEVYCSGTPGNLQHLIGKTNNQPPIVEVTPGQFAMVKIGQGQPYKSTNAAGITTGADSVTFKDAQLGSATLNGTLSCTQWQG